MRKKYSEFKKLCSYLNKFGSYSTITRKEIKKKFPSSRITVDIYRRYLTAAGFLEHTGRGKYMLIAPITNNLSLTELKKLAYGDKKDSLSRFG